MQFQPFLSPLFSFLIILKVSIFFSGARGESSYNLRVPHLGSKGCICDVQDEGFGGGELQLKKDLIVALDEVNTLKEKAKTLSDDLRAEQ